MPAEDCLKTEHPELYATVSNPAYTQPFSSCFAIASALALTSTRLIPCSQVHAQIVRDA